MLRDVFTFFRPGNPRNPFSRVQVDHHVRLNLAGGEPLLFPEEVLDIVSAANEIGYSASLITNGSTLTSNLIRRLAPRLVILGISVDSGVSAVNKKIGREDRHGRQLSLVELQKHLDLAKTINPQLCLKANTVVNVLNCGEDMSELIHSLPVDRWKVQRMLPVITNNLAIEAQAFKDFAACHAGLGRRLSFEDNIDMAESYIMIDPQGCFFQNQLGKQDYVYSLPILNVGTEIAFAQVGIDVGKFCARYVDGSEEGHDAL
jgi:radical S-adenosyl methionine domain-containing protein 2